MSDREELKKIALFVAGAIVGAYILSGPIMIAFQLLFLIPFLAFSMALLLALNPLVWAICLLAYVIKRI
jgi:hypothetical protein